VPDSRGEPGGAAVRSARGEGLDPSRGATVEEIGSTSWIFWAPLVAAALHIVGGFFVPGGFPAWDPRHPPEIAESIKPRFHLIINLLLLILCYDVGALRSSRYGPAAWMAVTALLFANAVWHLVGALRTRSYSPGMVTGLLLYIPITVYGYAHLLGA